MCVLGIAVALLCGAFSNAADANPLWTSKYLKAEGAGQLSTCVASISYNDGYFMVRLHGEELDMIFYRDDFTLPYGESLGAVSLQIDGQEYLTVAFSGDRNQRSHHDSAQAMFLYPPRSDFTPLFNALKFGSSVSIVFPSGRSYEVGLAGSDRALSAASNCWSRNFTGPHSNNPFEKNDAVPQSSQKNNPFDDT